MSRKLSSSNPLAILALAAVVGSVLLSIPNSLRYGRLASVLAGKSMAERGRIGADEWQSFLARAGRPAKQRAYARTRSDREPRRSAASEGWSWIVEAGQELPADAKIYLNFPSALYYYYGSSIWYPRRVDVTAEPAVIKDGETLRRHAVETTSADRADLLGRGYTHLVVSDQAGLRLIDLRTP